MCAEMGTAPLRAASAATSPPSTTSSVAVDPARRRRRRRRRRPRRVFAAFARADSRDAREREREGEREAAETRVFPSDRDRRASGVPREGSLNQARTPQGFTGTAGLLGALGVHLDERDRLRTRSHSSLTQNARARARLTFGLETQKGRRRLAMAAGRCRASAARVCAGDRFFSPAMPAPSGTHGALPRQKKVLRESHALYRSRALSLSLGQSFPARARAAGARGPRRR